MCNFCSKKVYESCKEVEKTGVDMGDFANALELSVWMMFDDDGDTKMDFSLLSSYGEIIKEISIPIKYCPVCGREL